MVRGEINREVSFLLSLVHGVEVLVYVALVLVLIQNFFCTGAEIFELSAFLLRLLELLSEILYLRLVKILEVPGEHQKIKKLFFIFGL